MEWSKIKNIILVILLGINLILLSVVGYQEHETAAYEAQALTSVLKLLDNNGIRVDRDRLPRSMTLDTLQVDGVLPDAQEDTKTRVSTLLGDVSRVEESAGGMRTTYYGANGSAEFSSSGRFSFLLAPGAVPLDSLDPGRHGSELLDALGFDGVLARTERDDGTLTLTYWQIWDGVPVFSCQSILTSEDGFLHRIEGQQVLGSATVVSSDPPLSVSTILLHFLSGMTQGGYVCSEISAMTVGY